MGCGWKVIATERDPSSVKVSELMNTNLFAVKSTDDLLSVAKTMDDKNVAGLPVIDDGKLVGVVTMWDIMIAKGVHCKAS